MGTTLDKPLYYVNLTHILACVGLRFILFFITSTEPVNMQLCSYGKTPIVKSDRFSKGQCPQNDIKRDQMKAVPYSLVLGSLMYA